MKKIILFFALACGVILYADAAPPTQSKKISNVVFHFDAAAAVTPVPGWEAMNATTIAAGKLFEEYIPASLSSAIKNTATYKDNDQAAVLAKIPINIRPATSKVMYRNYCKKETDKLPAARPITKEGYDNDIAAALNNKNSA